MKSLLSLQELVAEAAVLLSEAAIDQPSGRVSDVPTVRTVRYYASHGLLDKPAAHRGRAALYNHTHLMQLLAIKRLQAQGLTLEQVKSVRFAECISFLLQCTTVRWQVVGMIARLQAWSLTADWKHPKLSNDLESLMGSDNDHLALVHLCDRRKCLAPCSCAVAA